MLRRQSQWLCYLLIISFVRVLNFLPLALRRSIVTAIVYLVFNFVPSFRKISRKNLSLAFPERSEEWREAIRKASLNNLACLIVDFLRLPQIDLAWTQKHIKGSPDCEPARLANLFPNRPILYAVGHLGSFELMAHTQALRGWPLDFIVRDFKNPFLDGWVKRNRELSGNHTLSRKGALKLVIKALRSGRAAGILFDQNVTHNYAVFVDWFSHPAATTRALAVAALRSRAIIVCGALLHCKQENYFEEGMFIDLSHVYDDVILSDEEKTKLITQKTTDCLVGLIEKYPEHWFWFHRRWKTRPSGELEDFYS